MTPLERMTAFAQSVYLTKNNRYFDDIDEEDGQTYVTQTVDWLTLLLDELEREADWNCVRNWDDEIGTVLAPGQQTFDLPVGTRKLVVDDDRPLVIMHDNVIVASFEVVDPNQITKRYTSTKDRVTVIKKKIIFSRPLKDTEVNGTVIADTISPLPRPVITGPSPQVDIFDTFEPMQLLVLGVAKNATLPDIVQGPLSPSYVQKYGDLLEKTVMENNASSTSDEIVRDDFGYIGGI